MAETRRVSKKARDTFFRELGELVFWFAMAENSIYLIAIAMLGGSRVAGPVLKNLHLDRAIELAKELGRRKYSKSARRAAFESALVDFKRCAVERNELLHGVAFPRKDEAGRQQVITVISARTMKDAVRERKHVAALSGRVRNVSVRFGSAALCRPALPLTLEGPSRTCTLG